MAALRISAGDSEVSRANTRLALFGFQVFELFSQLGVLKAVIHRHKMLSSSEEKSSGNDCSANQDQQHILPIKLDRLSGRGGSYSLFSTSFEFAYDSVNTWGSYLKFFDGPEFCTS